MERIKIFISSVQSEFAEERAMLCDYIRTDVLLGKFFDPFIFEEVPANERSATDVYLDEVGRSDIYLGICGVLYGNAGPDGVSPTEREYDTATRLCKSRLIFIKTVGEGDRQPREEAFVRKIERDVVRKAFADAAGLRTCVYASLVRYMEEKEYIRWKPFDAACDSGATVDDLDVDKMRTFIRAAREKRRFPLSENAPAGELLEHLNLLDGQGRVANAAVLLFGRNPQKLFVTSEVKCALFYGDRVEKPMSSYQIFKGDVFELVDQATFFVMNNVNLWVGTRERGPTAAVPTRPELPGDAVREAIVNAVCHRDYTSRGSVQVMIFRDRVEVWNPGRLPYGLTVEMLRGPHSSLPANPLIAEPMYFSGYIEKMGTGTENIVTQCLDYGLRAPEFRVDEGGFKVVIWRAAKPVQYTLDHEPARRVQDGDADPKAIRKRSKNDPKTIQKAERGLRRLIDENPVVSRAELAGRLGLSERQVRRIMDRLRASGELTREGGRRGRWILKKS